jgi:hypothetical protein
MTQTFILFIVLTALVSCHSVDKKKTGNKKQLQIVVEVVPESDSSYSISWRDTVGKSAGYGLTNRPTEVWCFVMDNSDTVGHYRGLSTPADYTYFSTTDTTVKVTFMIGPNIFSEQIGKGVAPEGVIEFNPVDLNLKSRLRQPVEFVLTERRKLPLTSAL